MQKSLLLMGALLASYPVFSQCDVLVSDFPHGDCEGSDIELFAAASGNFNNVSYQWTGPNGYSSTNAYVFIAQAAASCSGTYSVTITTDNGCSATKLVSVTRHALPQVYTGGTAGGCLNTETSIYATDVSGNHAPYTYLWETGQTTQSIQVSHNGVSYPAPACTVTNAHGCSATNLSSFMIYTQPSPAPVVIEETGATPFCEGKSVVLVSDADSSLALLWKRYSKPISFNGTGLSYTAKKAGKYRVVATNAFGCSVTSNSVTVTVIEKPEAQVTNLGNAVFCAGDSTLLEANGGTNLTYQWKRYSHMLAGATGQQAYVSKTGNYRVVVTNAFGCSRESLSEKISVMCRESIKTQSPVPSVRAWPNPSNSRFTIDGGSAGDVYRVVVSDLSGRAVREYGEVPMPFSFGENLDPGTYFITLSGHGKTTSQVIIKTN